MICRGNKKGQTSKDLPFEYSKLVIKPLRYSQPVGLFDRQLP